MKIFILFDGEYSDRHVVGVFLDKALAEKVAAADAGTSSYDRYGPDIEEFDVTEVVDPVDVLTINTDLSESLSVAGEAGSPSTRERVTTHCRPLADPPRVEASAYLGYDGVVRIEVTGWDHAAVRKAHSERLAHEIAEFHLRIPEIRRFAASPKIETSMAFIVTSEG